MRVASVSRLIKDKFSRKYKMVGFNTKLSKTKLRTV